MIHPSTFLSRALLADALFSGVAAVALTLGAGALAPFLNLPEALLRETGLFLIAYTALVGWLAARSSVPKALVLLVIVGNAAWALGSIALLFSGAVSPNLLGQVFIVAQAIATGVFAELQYIGLRKSGETVGDLRLRAKRRSNTSHRNGRWIASSLSFLAMPMNGRLPRTETAINCELDNSLRQRQRIIMIATT